MLIVETIVLFESLSNGTTYYLFLGTESESNMTELFSATVIPGLTRTWINTGLLPRILTTWHHYTVGDNGVFDIRHLFCDFKDLIKGQTMFLGEFKMGWLDLQAFSGMSTLTSGRWL
jgi:hypothetical protein